MAIEFQSQETTPTPLPVCEIRHHGVMSYADGVALQRRLVEQRAAGEIPDQLVLLQHPHVVTMGRNTQDGNVLFGEEALRARGVELHEADRGGDVTYHGPGQLVAYPIIDLKPDRCDLHRYVRDLEAVLRATLADFGVTGHTVEGRTGVWVHRPDLPEAKIAAIGVRVSRWITSHGIALNVAPELQYFKLIVPCGLQQSAVTSLDEMLPQPPTLQAVGERFAAHFGMVFERRMQSETGESGREMGTGRQ